MVAASGEKQRNRAGFEQELSRLRAIRNSDALGPMIAQGVPAGDLLRLAETLAEARWASANGRLGEALRRYREAVVVEQNIPYMEPPYWYYPVHQSLGAALYRAGRYREPGEAFETALAQSPNNGWALYGASASERALGRRAEAAAANAAPRNAWSGDPAWLRMERL
jgi:tetratricopeptide (TPR) repeat protein